MIKYKIFVIFHNEINISYYDESILKNLVFVNVNPNNKIEYANINIINLYDIENFISLGKWYTESEVIYNIYKNSDILNGVDYVGFTHYDIDFTPISDNSLQNNFNQADVINLQPYAFREDFDQKILMDIDQPNRLKGKGKNCYLSIFDDFNQYHDSAHSINQYLNNAQINLCSSYIVKKSIFNEMMVFISSIIESGKLDSYDTNHKHRIQGGLLERYYAVWFLLKQTKSLNLKLVHHFIQTKKQESLFNQFKNRISAYIKKNLNVHNS